MTSFYFHVERVVSHVDVRRKWRVRRTPDFAFFVSPGGDAAIILRFRQVFGKGGEPSSRRRVTLFAVHFRLVDGSFRCRSCVLRVIISRDFVFIRPEALFCSRRAQIDQLRERLCEMFVYHFPDAHRVQIFLFRFQHVSSIVRN